MSRDYRNGGQHWDFERYEFVAVAIILTIILTSADIILVLHAHKDRPESSAELLHDVFQGFLLVLVASFTAASLLRWFRHRQELFEAFEKFTVLNKHDDIRELLHNITAISVSIKAKRWPRHASEYLVEKLESMRSFAQSLNSGKLDRVPYDVAMEHEPRIFLRSRGLVFVTSYGDMGWWNTEAGRRLFDSNKDAIRANRCHIIRLFILPPYEGQVAALPDNFREIVKRQLEAGITVRVAFESHIDREFHKDIAIFYKDKLGEDIRFVSEWVNDPDGDGHECAVWYFDHERLNFYRRMHRRLVEDQSELIDSVESLSTYLDRYSPTSPS